MMESTLEMAAAAMHGVLHGPDTGFRGVSTDTRTIASGELFVAIAGPNFDGSRFVNEAARRHAAGVVVASAVEDGLPQIRVDDTRLALGLLARDWRRKMPATVIGITGSNGKTTLKEMVASCLSVAAQTLATRGNLNNDIGLPLMLTRLSADDVYAVFEMGANHAGEIAYLAGLAQPSIVAITNAGPAHLEGFGSIDGVARAKGEILQTDPPVRIAVLNADDDYFDFWSALASGADLISFGFADTASVRASDIIVGASRSRFTLHTPLGSVAVELPIAGRHNVRNACAAAAIAIGAGLSLDGVVSGLANVSPVTGRLRPLAGVRGARIFDDSYNANPASVKAAAEFLAAQEGDAILVLADMGELGDDSDALHTAVGKAAKDAGVGRLLATGEHCHHTVEAFGDGATWYARVEDLTDALHDLLHARANVLIKGSRAMQMDRVVRAVSADADADTVH